MRLSITTSRLLSALGLLLVLAAAPAWAGSKVALVIGNADYQSAPLRNPANDARDMTAALQRLGFEVLTSTNADKRAMVHAIDDFAQKVRGAEVGLFYYSGHGVQIGGRNYLLPVRAQIKAEVDVELESVDVYRVIGRMEDSGARLNVVVLDACRDNPFARNFRSASRGLATMNAPVGTVIAYSTAPGSVAADGTGTNGVYTQHLLAALGTPGLELMDIFRNTRRNVVQATSGAQVPWESSSIMYEYYFAKGQRVPTEPAAHPQPPPQPPQQVASVAPQPRVEDLRERAKQEPQPVQTSTQGIVPPDFADKLEGRWIATHMCYNGLWRVSCRIELNIKTVDKNEVLVKGYAAMESFAISRFSENYFFDGPEVRLNLSLRGVDQYDILFMYQNGDTVGKITNKNILLKKK
jgi:hypothetical protein